MKTTKFRVFASLVLILSLVSALALCGCSSNADTETAQKTLVEIADVYWSEIEDETSISIETSEDDAFQYLDLQGYDYSNTTENYTFAYTYYDSYTDVLSAIMNGRAEAAYLPFETSEFFMSEHTGYTCIKGKWKLYYASMLRADETELRDQIDTALQAMRDDGTLDALVTQYVTNHDESAVEMPSTDGAQTVRIAITSCLNPLDYTSADGNAAGLVPAIYAEIGKRQNINFVPVYVGKSAAETALSSGKVDIVDLVRAPGGVIEDTDSAIFTSEYYTGTSSFLMPSSYYDESMWQENYGDSWSDVEVISN